MGKVSDIYEMLSGSIDRETIRVVLSISRGDTNEAVERLLELSTSGSTTDGDDLLTPRGATVNHRAMTHPSSSSSHSGSDDSKIFSRSFEAVNKHNSETTKRSSKEASSRKTVLSQKEAIALVRKYAYSKVVVIIRGCPGAGKSTLAKKLRLTGVVLSTDDYFSLHGINNFSSATLSKAQEWNLKRFQNAVAELKTPIIVDSINAQIGEMLPYASVADRFNYAIEVIEPDVHWRLNPDQLTKKTMHGIKKDKIVNILKSYDEGVCGNVLLRLVSEEEDVQVKDDLQNSEMDKRSDEFVSAEYTESVRGTDKIGDTQLKSPTAPDVNFVCKDDTEFLPPSNYFTGFEDEEFCGNLEETHLCSDHVNGSAVANHYEGISTSSETMDRNGMPDTWMTNHSNLYGFKPLVISPELGEQLLSLFGRPANFESQDHSVDLSIELAQMIHRAWTKGWQNDRSDGNSNFNGESSKVISEDVDPPDQKNLSSTKVKLMRLKDRFPRVSENRLMCILQESEYKMDVAMKTIKSFPELNATASENGHTNEVTDSSDHQTYADLVAKVTHSRQMFKEYMGKTKDAFSNKNFFQANFYSSKAQDWKRQLNKDKELCAEHLLKKTFEAAYSSGSIDLHGLKVKEALDVTSRLLQEFGPELYRRRSHLVVITGCGNHSVGGVAKIKPCIEQFLRRNEYKFCDATPGILKLDLKCVAGLLG